MKRLALALVAAAVLGIVAATSADAFWVPHGHFVCVRWSFFPWHHHCLLWRWVPWGW